jgi:hypothetical protein
MYLLVGVVIGILAWLFGSSAFPALLLRLASGFGWFLVLCFLVASALLFAAQRDPERFEPAAGLAAHFSARALAKTSAVLLGVCTVAFVCWLTVGSHAALGTLFAGLLLASVLIFFSWCLRALRPVVPASYSSGS